MFLNYLNSGSYKAEKIEENSIYLVQHKDNSNSQKIRKIHKIGGKFVCNCK